MSVSTPRPHAMEGPDFIGVGVPKAGTTWLARCLAEHPGVYFTTKEIAYFTRYFHRGYGWYDSHFRDKGSRIAGEITPSYFITPRESSWRKEFYPRINPRREVLFWRRRPSVRDEVRARYPGIKVFVVLRDPADRAWSYYWHWRERKDKLAKKVVPFEKMFRDDGRWIRSTGYYADWVEKWRAVFPDFGVFLHDDLKTDPDGLLRAVLTFLGIDGRFKPSFEGAPNPGRYEPLPAETRHALVEEYRPQVEKLSRLIGRDLSGWLAC